MIFNKFVPVVRQGKGDLLGKNELCSIERWTLSRFCSALRVLCSKSWSRFEASGISRFTFSEELASGFSNCFRFLIVFTARKILFHTIPKAFSAGWPKSSRAWRWPSFSEAFVILNFVCCSPREPSARWTCSQFEQQVQKVALQEIWNPVYVRVAFAVHLVSQNFSRRLIRLGLCTGLERILFPEFPSRFLLHLQVFVSSLIFRWIRASAELVTCMSHELNQEGWLVEDRKASSINWDDSLLVSDDVHIWSWKKQFRYIL